MRHEISSQFNYYQIIMESKEEKHRSSSATPFQQATPNVAIFNWNQPPPISTKAMSPNTELMKRISHNIPHSRIVPLDILCRNSNQTYENTHCQNNQFAIQTEQVLKHWNIQEESKLEPEHQAKQIHLFQPCRRDTARKQSANTVDKYSFNQVPAPSQMQVIQEQVEEHTPAQESLLKRRQRFNRDLRLDPIVIAIRGKDTLPRPPSLKLGLLQIQGGDGEGTGENGEEELPNSFKGGFFGIPEAPDESQAEDSNFSEPGNELEDGSSDCCSILLTPEKQVTQFNYSSSNRKSQTFNGSHSGTNEKRFMSALNVKQVTRTFIQRVL
ncbi:hypothetical protein FGO68_gene4496 [Halteria grandinella]|uniref:Uncharacterized protein n=1 Tax=Halteria grandinella TaxID=5974 RepID=A0A8J8T7W2_HALGN|nr:hypothetical protein FGO68_gene4496 [Halteria grandinella]